MRTKWSRASNLKRENSLFLPGITLPKALSVTHSLQDAVTGSGLIVLAVPSHAMRPVIRELTPSLSEPLPIVVASKGIEEESNQLMSQVLDELLPPDWARKITVLTGPSFAAEVSRDKPTTVLLAGQDAALTAHLQMVFMSASFRVYTGTDLIGAQLGGALKNVMAIAAGVVDGLELGLNARAALITRGLAEVIRLGVALGGRRAYVLRSFRLGGFGVNLYGLLESQSCRGTAIGPGPAVGGYSERNGHGGRRRSDHQSRHRVGSTVSGGDADCARRPCHVVRKQTAQADRR